MRSTNRLALVVVAAAAATMWSAKAEAAVILTADFCPGNASCPTGLTQARLTIDDNGTPAVNDYLITAMFTGDASAPAFLDMFSFTIAGARPPVAIPVSFRRRPRRRDVGDIL